MGTCPHCGSKANVDYDTCPVCNKEINWLTEEDFAKVLAKKASAENRDGCLPILFVIGLIVGVWYFWEDLVEVVETVNEVLA
jgi:uncharacterized membrane protein YvbJ